MLAEVKTEPSKAQGPEAQKPEGPRRRARLHKGAPQSRVSGYGASLLAMLQYKYTVQAKHLSGESFVPISKLIRRVAALVA